MTLFQGKYRGKVEDNADSKQLGRLQVSVPQVLGSSIKLWAMPCVPYAGPAVGLYAMPPKGANVWVEFEGGNPDYPIWTGCFWGEGEIPVQPVNPDVKIFRTAGAELRFDDTKETGSITLKLGEPAVKTPVSVTVNSNGLAVVAQGVKISLTAKDVEIAADPASLKLGSSAVAIAHGGATVKLESGRVSVNDGALEVT